MADHFRRAIEGAMQQVMIYSPALRVLSMTPGAPRPGQCGGRDAPRVGNRISHLSGSLCSGKSVFIWEGGFAQKGFAQASKKM